MYQKPQDYFDLKLRLHSLQITVIFATFLVVFLGWNIKSQIIKSIRTDISANIQPNISLIKSNVDSLKNDYDSLRIDLSKKITLIDELGQNYYLNIYP